MEGSEEGGTTDELTGMNISLNPLTECPFPLEISVRANLVWEMEKLGCQGVGYSWKFLECS